MKKLAFLVACVVAVFLPYSGSSQNAAGLNVTFVEYSCGGDRPAGHFSMTAPGVWKQTPAKDAYSLTFRETGRDSGSVYLLNDCGSMSIQLDVASRQVVLSLERGGRVKLYDVVRALSGSYDLAESLLKKSEK